MKGDCICEDKPAFPCDPFLLPILRQLQTIPLNQMVDFHSLFIPHQTNATFLKLAGPQLVQMFIGDGAKMVRDAFALAKEKAPCIIFIGERGFSRPQGCWGPRGRKGALADESHRFKKGGSL